MRGRMVTAVSLVLVGAVWIGQGFGLLRGSSFMVDDRRWAIAGIVALIVGALLAVRTWASRRRER